MKSEPNKYEIACAVAERLPELAPRLAPKRRIWQSEDYRMSIFDAAALGVAYFSRCKPSPDAKRKIRFVEVMQKEGLQLPLLGERKEMPQVKGRHHSGRSPIAPRLSTHSNQEDQNRKESPESFTGLGPFPCAALAPPA
jgi:hypothetical protein